MAVEKETQLEAWLEENMPEPGGGIITETFELNAAVGDDATDFMQFMDIAISAAASIGFCAISAAPVEQPANKVYFRYSNLTTGSGSHIEYRFGKYNRTNSISVSCFVDSATFRSVLASPYALTWYHSPIQ